MEPSSFIVETSAGRMDARWGWNGWISLTTPRSPESAHAAKRLVERRDDLEELFVGDRLGPREILYAPALPFVAGNRLGIETTISEQAAFDVRHGHHTAPRVVK